MKHMRSLAAALVLAWLIHAQAVAGQIAPFGGAREYVADLAARRARTMAALGSDSVLVLWSAPSRVYSDDVNYEYRQDSNLLYLTGMSQEQTILVLIPGARTARAHLFVRRGDPLRELWSGHTLTPDEVTAQSGIASVHPQRGTEAFDAFMAALLSGRPPIPNAQPDEFAALFDALSRGRARLMVVPRTDPPSTAGHGNGDDDSRVDWVREMERKFPGLKAASADELLTTQRQIKTPYEQTVLRRSVEISAEAHIEGMKAAKPDRWEYEVEAAIEGYFHAHGALSWGYPSIVGSGPNATILHYLSATRQMKDGDLLLVDAAGNYQGLTGDITRTYPVNGKFSAEQRALYEIVLRAQEAGIAAAKPGGRIDDIVQAVRAAIGSGLESLGFVTARSGPERDAQINLWFPHGPVHGIGMDVHDPLGALDPGAAFVIEPGLYIRPDAFERGSRTAVSETLARTLQPLVDRYRNIGVRVEDSFLMTNEGPVMLSRKAPRRVADIERVVGTGR
jgi:Xaa-Pro aminopeptidase